MGTRSRADCLRRLGLGPQASDDEIRTRLREEQRLATPRLNGPTADIRSEAQRRIEELQSIRESLGFRPGETTLPSSGDEKNVPRPFPEQPPARPTPPPTRPPTNDDERPPKSPRRFSRVLIGALMIASVYLLVLGIPNCGGGGRPPLSREAFIKQANAICKAGDTKLPEAGKDMLKDFTTTLDQWVKFYLEHAVPNARYKIEEIGKLEPPTKDKANVAKMLAGGRTATDSMEAGLKNQGAAYLGAKGPDPFTEFDALARKLKLSDCAKSLSPD